MTIGDETIHMNRSLSSSRISHSLKKINGHAENAGWSTSGQLIRKDGYEIYISDAHIELVMKDPDTRQEVIVYETDKMDISSPQLVGVVCAIVDNVENIAASSPKI